MLILMVFVKPVIKGIAGIYKNESASTMCASSTMYFINEDIVKSEIRLGFSFNGYNQRYTCARRSKRRYLQQNVPSDK